MNDTLLIQQVYPKRGYLPLLLENFERHAKYCDAMDIDYLALSSERLDANMGGWGKLYHVRRELDDYALVVWLDVDAFIFDTSRSLKDVPNPPDTLGVVRFLLPTSHLNTGVMYFRSGDRIAKYLDDWLAAYPGSSAWREQAVLNQRKSEAVYELPAEWNLNYNHNPNANPVVMGFHGFGLPERRIELMRKVIKNEKEKCQK